MPYVVRWCNPSFFLSLSQASRARPYNQGMAPSFAAFDFVKCSQMFPRVLGKKPLQPTGVQPLNVVGFSRTTWPVGGGLERASGGRSRRHQQHRLHLNLQLAMGSSMAIPYSLRDEAISCRFLGVIVSNRCTLRSSQ